MPKYDYTYSDRVCIDKVTDALTRHLSIDEVALSQVKGKRLLLVVNCSLPCLSGAYAPGACCSSLLIHSQSSFTFVSPKGFGLWAFAHLSYHY
ncbi:MAG: hypothetical protein L0H55_11765 [Candidatus Nitrosocosmicus sp.]|nr:hypothetical protein [Candidatus Nitrosocosmicus sp.]